MNINTTEEGKRYTLSQMEAVRKQRNNLQKELHELRKNINNGIFPTRVSLFAHGHYFTRYLLNNEYAEEMKCRCGFVIPPCYNENDVSNFMIREFSEIKICPTNKTKKMKTEEGKTAMQELSFLLVSRMEYADDELKSKLNFFHSWVIIQGIKKEKEQMKHSFEQSRLTHPMTGFKHNTFEEYYQETYPSTTSNKQ